MVFGHGGEESVAEGDLGRVVVDVGAGGAAVVCFGWGDGTFDFVLDIGQVEARGDDGREIVIGRVGVLGEVGVEVGFEVTALDIFEQELIAA
jgi:hypothetical protein